LRARRDQPRRLFRRIDAGTAGDVAARVIDEAISDGAGMGCLVVCTRVGRADFVPAGYELESCTDCHSPVWVNGTLVATARGRGMNIIPLCTDCLSDSPVPA
jgi:hypothetical protein